MISGALRERFAGLGGFRNVLVHGYMELDTATVASSHRDAPTLFSRFRLEVEEWLAGVESRGSDGEGSPGAGLEADEEE